MLHKVVKRYKNFNSTIKKVYYTLDGERHGEYLKYTSDGLLKVTCNYDKGLLEGSYITYHNGVMIICKTEYHAGLKHGKESTFRENGTLLSEATYENGKLNGSYFSYRSDGLRIYVILYFVNNIKKLVIFASNVSYKKISYAHAILNGVTWVTPFFHMRIDITDDPIILETFGNTDLSIHAYPLKNNGFNGFSIIEQNELVIEEFQKQLSLINK